MDTLGIHGIITLYEIPSQWTDQDFATLWPIMHKEEKRSRQILEVENLITNAGIATLLNNMSVAGQGNMQPFAQILSVGNGTLSGVTRADTSVVGDGFVPTARKAPASFRVSGFSTIVLFNFAATDAVGTWTNCGVYGMNVSGAQQATTTPATGQLNTHVLFSYVKNNSTAIGINYTFLLSN